jgi:L-lactate dehydrogenase complex protein LldG
MAVKAPVRSPWWIRCPFLNLRHMEESTSKEKVLTRIRNALITKTGSPFTSADMDTAVYHPVEDPPEITFAEEFIKASGKFVYCQNEEELVQNLNLVLDEMKDMKIFCLEEKIKGFLARTRHSFSGEPQDFPDTTVGITGCEFLIARLGSIMVSSRQLSGRRLNVFPPVHIVIAFTSQLVPDLKQAFQQMKARYGDALPSMITVITGPSRTADIEKTLVMGAHGPRDLYLFLVDDK